MGIQQIPLAASGVTLAEGNSAGWRRTQPAGLTLVASADWSSLTSTNTTTISSLSGYSFYRLFVIGYFNSAKLLMRINSNTDSRYDSYAKLGDSHELQRRASHWRLNLSNVATFNSTIMDIYDADSANYKFANAVGTASASGVTLGWFSWSKAEALSSITLFTESGSNFTSGGYDGQGYYLYGGY